MPPVPNGGAFISPDHSKLFRGKERIENAEFQTALSRLETLVVRFSEPLRGIGELQACIAELRASQVKAMNANDKATSDLRAELAEVKARLIKLEPDAA